MHNTEIVPANIPERRDSVGERPAFLSYAADDDGVVDDVDDGVVADGADVFDDGTATAVLVFLLSNICRRAIVAPPATSLYCVFVRSVSCKK